MKLIIVGSLISLFFFGCTPTKEITYKTSDISSLKDSFFSDKSLSINNFVDIRNTIEDAEILFNNNRIYERDGEKFCINSEKNYASVKIPEQVASIVRQHLFRTRIFKKVYTNSPEGTYSLTGEIQRLYGIQEFSRSAAVGANFGLIGMLATSGIKTEGTIRITLSKLQLVDTETDEIFDLEEIDLQFEGEYKVDGACWSIFENVNEKLKEAVESRLVPSIVHSLNN